MAPLQPFCSTRQNWIFVLPELQRYIQVSEKASQSAMGEELFSHLDPDPMSPYFDTVTSDARYQEQNCACTMSRYLRML